jgi:hypothetical protein
MKLALLVVAVALISASILVFIGIGPSTAPPRPQSERVLVSGRVVGDDLPDRPWTGTIIYFGSERAVLTRDGRFRFSALPGTHILTVCCSPRFQRIYREITVADRDIELELVARPLKEIPGRLIVRGQPQLAERVEVSAKLVGSNMVDRTVTAADGTFAFHLMEGDWQVNVENLPEGYTVHSMTLGGRQLPDGVLKIAGMIDSSLTLQITLR